MYKQIFTVTDADVDCFLKLKSSALFYYAQEVAARHSALLGASWETLSNKNLFWALIRTYAQVHRLPVLGETITVETWPMPATRVAYPRATVARDTQGNELFRLHSLWVLMDKTARTMVLPGKSGIDVPGECFGTEAPAPGSLPAKPTENLCYRTVQFSELDRNLHLNNTRYIEYMADLLPSSFHKTHALTDATVSYMAEVREGERLRLGWNLSDSGELYVDVYRVNSRDEATERVFSGRLNYSVVL